MISINCYLYAPKPPSLVYNRQVLTCKEYTQKEKKNVVAFCFMCGIDDGALFLNKISQTLSSGRKKMYRGNFQVIDFDGLYTQLDYKIVF